MKKRIKILLTFDYELPLGGIVKDYAHSLFDPTSKLLQLAEEIGVPIVLFADILSYTKFREWNVDEYTDQFSRQLNLAYSLGHDVQLHLHPHWLKTEYRSNQFVPSNKFSLSEFYNESYPNNIEGIITSGIKELTSLLYQNGGDYRCIAYRAGGYNLAPNTTEILEALYKNGIRYDSSIARGYYFVSDDSVVDFRNIPKTSNWYLPFNGDLSLANKSSNAIFEIPIATKPKGVFEIPTTFKLKKYAYRKVENRGKMIHSNSSVKKKDKIKQLLSSRMLTVDNHTYSIEYLMKILDYNVKKFKNEDEIVLSLIGHPKSMGNYHFEMLSAFVQSSKKKYGDEIVFVTFRDLYNENHHQMNS